MAKQLTFKKTSGWGGRRKKSGRKNLSGTVNHMTRPHVSLKTPLHITLRLKDKMPSIRRQFLHNEFKESINRAKEQGLYILHYSIQNNHIHLLAESKNNKALALGMRSLVGRFAKIIRQYAHQNANKKSKGSVFEGRYHLHVLKTPSEVKNTLEYVLLNLSKHQKFMEYVDHFSSAQYFKDWKILLGPKFRGLIKATIKNIEEVKAQEQDPKQEVGEFLSLPQSWLGQTGWMKASG